MARVVLPDPEHRVGRTLLLRKDKQQKRPRRDEPKGERDEAACLRKRTRSKQEDAHAVGHKGERCGLLAQCGEPDEGAHREQETRA